MEAKFSYHRALSGTMVTLPYHREDGQASYIKLGSANYSYYVNTHCWVLSVIQYCSGNRPRDDKREGLWCTVQVPTPKGNIRCASCICWPQRVHSLDYSVAAIGGSTTLKSGGSISCMNLCIKKSMDIQCSIIELQWYWIKIQWKITDTICALKNKFYAEKLLI